MGKHSPGDDVPISGALAPSTETLLKKRMHESCLSRRVKHSVTQYTRSRTLGVFIDFRKEPEIHSLEK